MWITLFGNINGMIYFCPSQLKLNKTYGKETTSNPPTIWW